MRLFKKKDKNRKNASQEDPRILPPDDELQAEADQIATETIASREAEVQSETEAAREEAESMTAQEENRQEAMRLARAAATGELQEAANAQPGDDDFEYDDDVDTYVDEEAEDEEVVYFEEDTAAEEAEVEKETPEDTTEEDEEAAEAEEAEEDAEASDEESEEQPQKGGFFRKLKAGLSKTRDAMLSGIQSLLGGRTKIDESLFEELEETLIMSDLGPETSMEICDQLRERVKERNITDPAAITDLLKEILSEMLGEDETLTYPTKPTIILMVGVNGSGKTTTIGKLSYQLVEEGKKVLVAAADTFRAAAIDQLEVWTQRAGADLVKHEEGSDPGAVVYDAIAAAKARDCDVLICDTAGRLHNKKNLMEELAKINRILKTQAPDAHMEVLLVLDATTGQNAVNQARMFQEVADITGIVLTKLDGTAKGGIVIPIRHELGIPVKLIGVGEKIEDLQPFHGQDFVEALFQEQEA